MEIWRKQTFFELCVRSIVASSILFVLTSGKGGKQSRDSPMSLSDEISNWGFEASRGEWCLQGCVQSRSVCRPPTADCPVRTQQLNPQGVSGPEPPWCLYLREGQVSSVPATGHGRRSRSAGVLYITSFPLHLSASCKHCPRPVKMSQIQGEGVVPGQGPYWGESGFYNLIQMEGDLRSSYLNPGITTIDRALGKPKSYCSH